MWSSDSVGTAHDVDLDFPSYLAAELSSSSPAVGALRLQSFATRIQGSLLRPPALQISAKYERCTYSRSFHFRQHEMYLLVTPG